MRKQLTTLLVATAVAVAACATTAESVGESTTSARGSATTTTTPATTTVPAASTTAAPPAFVTTGNEVHVYEAVVATHVVVLLHGMSSGPTQMRELAQRLNEDGAIVVAPKISMTSVTSAMGKPTSETACAVWFAHNLDRSLPIVMVGFSGGGLATGQYIADPSHVAEPELCATKYEPTQVTGAVLLDGPVWLTGYCETTGFCDADAEAMSHFDPVAYAVPQPDVQMEYFFSNDIADYPEEAAAKLDAALDITSPTTRSDITHNGLLRTEFYDAYAAAVLRIVSS